MGGEADEMDYKDEEDGRDVREEGEGNRDWSVAGELRRLCDTVAERPNDIRSLVRSSMWVWVCLRGSAECRRTII